MDTTVIIVSYKSEHLIEKYCNFSKETKIIIVDNSKNITQKKNRK